MDFNTFTRETISSFSETNALVFSLLTLFITHLKLKPRQNILLFYANLSHPLFYVGSPLCHPQDPRLLLPPCSTYPHKICHKILCLFFSSNSISFKRCPVFGKMNLGVLSAPREQRDHQLHLNCCPKHLATALHLIQARPL